MVKYVITATAWAENEDGSFTYDRTIVDHKFVRLKSFAMTKDDDRRHLSYAFAQIVAALGEDDGNAKKLK